MTRFARTRSCERIGERAPASRTADMATLGGDSVIRDSEVLVDEVGKFLCTATEYVLFLRSVYPPNVFEQRLLYGVYVYVARSSVLSEYVQQLVLGAQQLMLRNEAPELRLHAYEVTVYQELVASGEGPSQKVVRPLENFVFSLDVALSAHALSRGGDGVRRVDLAEAFRAILVQLSACDAKATSNLPLDTFPLFRVPPSSSPSLSPANRAGTFIDTTPGWAAEPGVRDHPPHADETRFRPHATASVESWGNTSAVAVPADAVGRDDRRWQRVFQVHLRCRGTPARHREAGGYRLGRAGGDGSGGSVRGVLNKAYQVPKGPGGLPRRIDDGAFPWAASAQMETPLLQPHGAAAPEAGRHVDDVMDVDGSDARNVADAPVHERVHVKPLASVEVTSGQSDTVLLRMTLDAEALV